MTVPPEAPERLRALSQAWAGNTANERAAFQSWMIDFCDALGVARPVPPTDDYRFELPVQVLDREGRESTNFIDCWKAGHFALEAKASGDTTENARNDSLLRRAYGQVRNYVAHVSGDPPPYLMVLDVPRTLIVWDRWSGSYGDFAAGRRIALETLHAREDDIALVYDIFTNPSVRDPRARAQAVTRDIAAGLGELAAELESRGLDTERVARFLMRCVFSCFAEDVGLLPENLFRRTLETARRSGDHERLAMALTALWQTMDRGGMFGAELLHRFNGHFFKTVEALPLEARDVDLLIDAAKHDWSRVEILERLVALHDERVAEEERGIVRWLRPEYQVPRFGKGIAAPELALATTEPRSTTTVSEPRRAWPGSAVEAQRALTPDELAAHFTGAKRDLVARHLETLAMMGEVTVDRYGRYAAARKAA